MPSKFILAVLKSIFQYCVIKAAFKASAGEFQPYETVRSVGGDVPGRARALTCSHFPMGTQIPVRRKSFPVRTTQDIPPEAMKALWDKALFHSFSSESRWKERSWLFDSLPGFCHGKVEESRRRGGGRKRRRMWGERKRKGKNLHIKRWRWRKYRLEKKMKV